jgi:hypothetical protein
VTASHALKGTHSGYSGAAHVCRRICANYFVSQTGSLLLQKPEHAELQSVITMGQACFIDIWLVTAAVKSPVNNTGGCFPAAFPQTKL